jgi:hypothetical protein
MAQGTTRGVPIDTDPLLTADSDLLVASQKATKAYADTKQAALGFTPEDVANKSTSTSLGTSNTLYPSQNAVKSYVDTGLSTKQNSLGFTPENVANKQSAVSTDANHYYNAPYINSILVTRIFITSDQTTTSNVAANITGLVTATLAANKTYIIRGVISVTSAVGATGGIRIGATLPTGATSIIFLSGRGSSTTMTQEASVDGALQTTASNRISAAASDLIVSGNITTSSTAGTVQFRFASGTNLQSNSVIAARTYIEIFEKL